MVARALEGIRVVELTNFVAGPFAGLALADLGAEVIKIERLDGGDDGRLGPPFLDGEGYFFVDCNRNKRSMAIDLAQPEGAALARRLVLGSDVVLNNFRPGVMERLGLGYEGLQAENPRLIGCSVTGFGEDTAYAERAGYDPILQAMSGLMLATGFDGDPPVRVGPSIIDKTAAIWAANGVLAALFERERTGMGQQVSVSLLGAAVQIMSQYILRYLATGTETPRLGGTGSGGGPSGSFQAGDERWFQLAVGNDRIFRRFCDAIGRSELAVDPRFAAVPERSRNAASLIGIIEAVLLEQPAEEWVTRLEAAGVPCSPVNTVGKFVADPEVGRQFIWEMTRSTGESIAQVRTPLVLDPEAPRRAPPCLGEHTDEILAAELGLSETEIAALKLEGVIR